MGVQTLAGQVGHVLAGVDHHVVDAEFTSAVADGVQAEREEVRGIGVHALQTRPTGPAPAHVGG